MGRADNPPSDARAEAAVDAAAPAPESRHLLRDPVWWVAFALLFGLAATWAFASPLFSVPDEPAHTVKAAAVVRGQVIGSTVKVPDEGEGLFRGGFTVLVRVPLSYTFNTSALPECYIFDADTPAGCAPAFTDEPDEGSWTTWVGRYPPTFYGLVGWPTLFDTGTTSVYLMRLLNAAICAALLATALTCAREARRFRFVSLGVLVAATPEVFFLAGSVNPNGLEAAAAICFWASLGVAVLREEPGVPGHLLGSVAVSGALLAFTRPLSTLWVAVAIAGVLAIVGTPRRIAELLRLTRVRVVAAIVGLAAVGSLVWTMLTDALGNVRGDDPRGLGYADALWHALGRVPRYLREMVAVFGWRTTPTPEVLTWAWALALVVVVVLAVSLGNRRLRLGVLTLLALMVLAPAFMEAVDARDNGFPWQGRYGIPLAAGVPIVAALGIGASRWLEGKRAARVAGALVAITAGVQVLAHYWSTRRYVVGNDGPLFYLGEHGWDPPLPTWFLLLATLATAGGLGLLTFRIVTTDDPIARRGTSREHALAGA